MWAFSSSGKLGLLFIAVCELLIAVASPVEEQRLCTQASVLWHTGLVFAAHGLSSAAAVALRLSCSWHVESSQTLIHCATRQVPMSTIFKCTI